MPPLLDLSKEEIAEKLIASIKDYDATLERATTALQKIADLAESDGDADDICVHAIAIAINALEEINASCSNQGSLRSDQRQKGR